LTWRGGLILEWQGQTGDQVDLILDMFPLLSCVFTAALAAGLHVSSYTFQLAKSFPRLYDPGLIIGIATESSGFPKRGLVLNTWGDYSPMKHAKRRVDVVSYMLPSAQSHSDRFIAGSEVARGYKI
jgi:hypothetical protein